MLAFLDALREDIWTRYAEVNALRRVQRAAPVDDVGDTRDVSLATILDSTSNESSPTATVYLARSPPVTRSTVTSTISPSTFSNATVSPVRIASSIASC